ncbi:MULTISPECIES: ROK family protein [unclassified Thioalkalivibrio]|uniref:glucokinase n=1 Tax=unclassified Thioalkalivibrio TaxID=2621013 RepID=UPI00035CE1FA|nr:MULTISPECIES: ROK family protein [unclassified Thioalkalivibrio]
MDFMVADIGGTRTRVARARRSGAHWSLHDIRRYPSRDFPDLDHILEVWRNEVEPAEPLAAAGLALAGPVQSGRARATNLDWPELDAYALEQALGIPVALINDFAAVGACLDALEPGDRITLQNAAADPEGLRLVVGAGTGLGTCLVGPRQQPAIHPGEGGHARFSPADANEAALAAFVSAEEGLCTREHLLSGRGIARIARFELARRDDGELARALTAADPAAAISDLADAGHAAALAVVQRFVTIYAGQLADMALTALPTGGLYLAGGIAPRWADYFQDTTFLRALHNRPPMTHLLERLPVSLIMHPEPGLLGAAVSAWFQTGAATE